MKRIATCLYRRNDHVLLLQKPKRGWWSCPGGKMEPAETILETVRREFREETGLEIIAPRLRGIFTVVVYDEGMPQEEWMHFFFLAHQAAGEQLAETHEGRLEWHPLDRLAHLPMAEGDRLVLQQMLRHDALMVGRFHYTTDYRLLGYDLTETEHVQYTS